MPIDDAINKQPDGSFNVDGRGDALLACKFGATRALACMSPV